MVILQAKIQNLFKKNIKLSDQKYLKIFLRVIKLEEQ